MANNIETVLRQKFAELAPFGATIKADGSLGFKDPKADEAWAAFRDANAGRAQAAAVVPDGAARSAENALLAARTQADSKRLLDAATIENARNQIPLVEAKEAITTKNYGDRLGIQASIKDQLLANQRAHEKDLYGMEGQNLDKLIGADDRYYDRVTSLAEKQLQQQGTANILNLITNLALGGAALFA